MTLSDTALIALSVCMIIFPAFIIIPSAFMLIKRIAEFWCMAITIASFGVAGLSLLAAAIYSAIALFNQHSAINSSLGVLVILLTIAILYFLYKLQQWLYELAIVDVISEAEAKGA